MEKVSIFRFVMVFLLAVSWCPPAGAQSAVPVPQSWSTNFASVTDLAASGVFPFQTKAAIETSMVNSGGKSVKAYGVIGTRDTCLNINFVFSGLAGWDSVDLSDKLLNIEMYLPADSPIFDLLVHVFSNGRFVMVRGVHTTLCKGQWHMYSVDLRQDIAMKTWRAYSSMTSPGLTDEQAADVIRNAQSVAVIGCVSWDHSPAESYVLIDRMGWDPAGPAPAYDPGVESLRSHVPPHLPIGAYLETDGVTTPHWIRNFIQQFNASLTWCELPPTEPPALSFHFDETWNRSPYADYLNETHGFKLLRYAWGANSNSAVPAWLPSKSYADAQTVLRNYIRELVGHYKGKTYIWNVFNELLRYDLHLGINGLGLKDRNQASPRTMSNNYSPWCNSPSDLTMIEDALRVARTADPQALLIINESYSAEKGSRGAEALYRMVTKMKSDGTPLDGVGFECHIVMDQSGSFYEAATYKPKLVFDRTKGFTGIAANVERFAASGINVAFTEVDVAIYLADINPASAEGKALLVQRRELQAAAYRSLLRIALTHPNVVAFNLFDWADEYSYVDPESGATYVPKGLGTDIGLFDLSYRKKPSYFALLEELKSH